ncbi:YdcF family protein [Candidatus Peregrinibacteria bacterium]|nr:MAG: YdcF family protein [Candidatus Peregrinibacteria bacterium]
MASKLTLSTISLFKKHWKKGLLIALLGGVTFMGSPFLVQRWALDKIFTVEQITEQPVAIVFGAGIGKNGGPSDALYDRLTVASQLYKAGKVSSILVSGDNSTEDYNEPEVMKNTLINAFAIPPNAITQDFAGRRTYDTCIRAKTLFGVEKAILVTQEFHLPRALYTCNSLGIESSGVSASLQPYIFGDYYEFREYAATLQMGVDLYLWSPDYIE